MRTKSTPSAASESATPDHPAAHGLTRLATVAFCILLFSTSGGAADQSTSCGGSLKISQVAQLLFGRGLKDGAELTEGDWSGFVARELTPRFPKGFTVIDSVGQWQNAQGAVTHQTSKVVEIALPGDSDDSAKLDAIVDAYKLQFHQKSVGLIIAPACVRF